MTEPAAGLTSIPAGEEFDHFGPETGRWLYPKGVSFASRSLPPESLVEPYQTYTATGEPLLPGWSLEESRAVAWFGQPGGGVQYQIVAPPGELPCVESLVLMGVLEPGSWK